jgi:hypothetical protein
LQRLCNHGSKLSQPELDQDGDIFADTLVYGDWADSNNGGRGCGSAGHRVELAILEHNAARAVLGDWPITRSAVANPATACDLVSAPATAIQLKQ